MGVNVLGVSQSANSNNKYGNNVRGALAGEPVNQVAQANNASNSKQVKYDDKWIVWLTELYYQHLAGAAHDEWGARGYAQDDFRYIEVNLPKINMSSEQAIKIIDAAIGHIEKISEEDEVRQGALMVLGELSMSNIPQEKKAQLIDYLLKTIANLKTLTKRFVDTGDVMWRSYDGLEFSAYKALEKFVISPKVSAVNKDKIGNAFIATLRGNNLRAVLSVFSSLSNIARADSSLAWKERMIAPLINIFTNVEKISWVDIPIKYDDLSERNWDICDRVSYVLAAFANSNISEAAKTKIADASVRAAKSRPKEAPAFIARLIMSKLSDNQKMRIINSLIEGSHSNNKDVKKNCIYVLDELSTYDFMGVSSEEFYNKLEKALKGH